MKISGKFILRVAGTLTAICLVVSALLGGVNAVTADRIAAIKEKNTRDSLSSVLPNCDYDPLELSDTLTAAVTGQGAKLKAAYKAAAAGELVGYAFQIVSSGSQGDIDMIVGVDTDGKVTGVSIVDNKETSGIGSKVMGNEPLPGGTGVLDQFVGKSGAGSLVVKKNVDAISGATVSSKGVTRGVNAALAAAEALA